MLRSDPDAQWWSGYLYAFPPPPSSSGPDTIYVHSYSVAGGKSGTRCPNVKCEQKHTRYIMYLGHIHLR